MQLLIAAIGRARGTPEAALVEDYQSRLSPFAKSLAFGPLAVREIEAATGPTKRETETGALLAAAEGAERLVALDPRGREIMSEALAEMLGAWRDDGVRSACFLIGGADGLERDRVAAHATVSFGRATWPHLLVRAMLAEQLYRCATILAGHPYHRGG